MQQTLSSHPLTLVMCNIASIQETIWCVACLARGVALQFHMRPELALWCCLQKVFRNQRLVIPAGSSTSLCNPNITRINIGAMQVRWGITQDAPRGSKTAVQGHQKTTSGRRRTGTRFCAAPAVQRYCVWHNGQTSLA